MSKKQVHVLYGTAERNHAEKVCMFFATKADREEFKKKLPGTYKTMTLTGIDYDDFEVV